MNRDDARRSTWGALLGGMFGSALGAGLTGLWDWVYLFNVPVHHGTEVLIGLAVGGLGGIAWGFLAAYPRRWWIGAFLSGAMVAVLLCLLPTTRLLLIVLPSALAAWILAGLLRGLLRAFHLARLRRNQAKAVWPSLVILSAFLFGLATTWPLDQMSESVDGRRAVLQKVHRYGQAQGWKDYVLQLDSMDSDYASVTVAMSNGEVYTCRVSQWEEPTLGDPAFYDLLGITCWP
jgi:hypothetical protein